MILNSQAARNSPGQDGLTGTQGTDEKDYRAAGELGCKAGTQALACRECLFGTRAVKRAPAHDSRVVQRGWRVNARSAGRSCRTRRSCRGREGDRGLREAFPAS